MTERFRDKYYIWLGIAKHVSELEPEIFFGILFFCQAKT